jgi:predicted nuclease of predicted toxin-antitoxin system
MNFLVDMNLSPDWAEFLTGAGFTAVHWSDEGPPTALDRDLTAWAADRGLIVVTAGIDAAAWSAPDGHKGPGVLLLGQGDLTPDRRGGAVLAAIHKAREPLSAGAVVVLTGEDVQVQRRA